MPFALFYLATASWFDCTKYNKEVAETSKAECSQLLFALLRDSIAWSGFGLRKVLSIRTVRTATTSSGNRRDISHSTVL